MENNTKITLGQTLYYIIQNKDKDRCFDDNILRKCVVTNIDDDYFYINNLKERFCISSLRDMSYIFYKLVSRTIFIFLSNEHYETVNKQKEIAKQIKDIANNPRFSELPLVKLERIYNDLTKNLF